MSRLTPRKLAELDGLFAEANAKRQQEKAEARRQSEALSQSKQASAATSEEKK